jgi:hypothetical protein
MVMIRKMGQFDVLQRTKDGMFNGTNLLKQWNDVPSNPKRDLSKFWEQDKVKDFIEIVLNEENLHTPAEVYVKSKASRGDNAGTWMHPILFIKFAMWLNPKFEYFVIKFVYDQLIEYRHSAGDNYRGLASAIQRFDNVNFAQVAKGLNYIVFGRHDENLRQQASQKQLQELTNLQNQLAFAVDMGYIRSYEELINEMRRIYHYKSRYGLANETRRKIPCVN